MVECLEEADREVALASASQPHCYSVGADSDYCLFPNVKYIPLSSLNADDTGGLLTGSLITRQLLAQVLELPHESLMVEMAILAGNDYIGEDSMLDYQPQNNYESIYEILEYLRDKDESYQAWTASDDPQVQRALDFTRALYNFEPLDDFPLDNNDDEEEDEDDEDDLSVVLSSDYGSNDSSDYEEEDSSDEEDEFDRPKIPLELDLAMAIPNPLDFSFIDVVKRPLQAYVDSFPADSAKRRLSQEHLDAFSGLAKQLQHENASSLPKDVRIGRPKWEDVVACYIIEKTMMHVLRANPSSPIVRYVSPGKVFDHYRFHVMMKASRDKEEEEKKEMDASSHSVGQAAKPPPPTARHEPTVLPIDSHEDEILEAVQKNQVTIIHGETGCGKSSRVPVMLLRTRPPDPSYSDVKIFISQPRRIAAKSLVERVRSCEPDLKDTFALRMGHGVREYESSRTRAWFVTTGYLVRLLANHPEKFDNISHIIIDEGKSKC
jgi:hypothetical protein